MLDSLILFKLAALGCFGIIIITIGTILRWDEEESYKNEDGPTDSTGLTTAEDTDLNGQACEENCEKNFEENFEENSSALPGTCTISNEPESKTNPGLVPIKRFHIFHTSAKQTPPVDEIIDLVQQCLSLHGCKGNIRCYTGMISRDLTIDISLKVPDNKRNSTPSD